MISIGQAKSLEAVEAARGLFVEYGALPDVNIPRHEIAGLPGEYAPPSGALLIAMDGEAAAGCVALRKLGKDTCEMKRLFVRPKYRGQDLGKSLVHEIIARAQDLGYARMLLDSRPSMQAAIRLYRSVGFREIASYMADSVPGALFFELELIIIAHASG